MDIISNSLPRSSLGISSEKVYRDKLVEEPEQLSIEEVAQRIVEVEKKNRPKVENSFFDRFFAYDEEKEKEKIIQKETALRKYQAILPEEWDSYEAAGGLKWSMSLIQIAAHVQKKFDELRASGLLLFRSEFLAKENPLKFRSLGVIFQPGQRSGDLARLWGAEYLRQKLAQREEYKVPRFVVVIEDDVKTLPISLWCGTHSLHINSFPTDSGEILVENIVHGRRVACEQNHRWMVQLGYVDYSDPGNILEGEDGKYYVVDTEWTSLAGVTERNQEARGIYMLRQYAMQRFAAFHPWFSKVVDVEIRK